MLSPNDLAPALDAAQNLFAVLICCKRFIIAEPAEVYVFILNNEPIALPALPTSYIVFAPATGAKAPPERAVAPHNANSSRAILDIIPTVYELLRNRSLKNPLVPPLPDLPILIASSIACAPIKSELNTSPVNMSPIDLHPDVNAGPHIAAH